MDSITKREKVKQVLLIMIAEEGFQASPMADLANRADTAVGTIYHHFSSKEEILDEIYLDIKEIEGNAFFKGFTTSMSYREKFFMLWRNLFDFWTESEKQFYFLEHTEGAKVISDSAKKLGEIHYYPFFDFIQTGILTKEIRDAETELIATVCLGQILTAVRFHLSERLLMTEERIRQFQEMSWDAVKFKL